MSSVQVRFPARPRPSAASSTRSRTTPGWTGSSPKETVHRLCRLRRDGDQPAHRQPDHRDDALLAAGDRPPADRADGRRHLDDRRSFLPRRAAQAADARGDRRPTSRASSRSSAASCSFGDGPTDAIMVNNADWLLEAQLCRVPARRRPAFLGQPHAHLRLRQAAPRARAVAVLPRIQLHDPAGLRLRRAQPALWLPCCRWAAPTSGATSSTASTSATAWARRSSTP